MAVAMGATVVLATAALGRSFVQRRSIGGVWWIAGGAALAASSFVTTLCASPELSHVLAAHALPALAMLLLGGLLGAALHRRAWREPPTRSDA